MLKARAGQRQTWSAMPRKAQADTMAKYLAGTNYQPTCRNWSSPMQHKGAPDALAGGWDAFSALSVVWVPKPDDRAVWAFFGGLVALILNWQIS